MPIDPMRNASSMLDLIAKRQNALGENLANIDTPGYQRKDIDFSQYLSSNGNPLESDLASRFGTTQALEQTSNEEINPAHELMELQKNSLLYTMASREISSVITQMKTVINVGK